MRHSAGFIGKTLLILFLFSCFFLGGLIVGPVSVRMYLSLVFFVYLVIKGFRVPLLKEIVIYAVFVLSYIVALLMNGEFGEVDFLKYFFGRYFICFLAFFGVYSLVNRKSDFEMVIWVVFVFGLINGIVSVLQYAGNQWAMQLPLFLNLGEIQQDKIITQSTKFGLGVGTMGLFNSIVINGYLSSVFAIFSVSLYHIQRIHASRFFMLFTSLFLLMVIFLIQQRLVFIMVASFFAFYFLKNQRLFKYVFVSIFVIGAYVAFFELNVDQESLGRIGNFQDDNRMVILDSALYFIANNFFFGGQLAFGSLLLNNGMDVNTAHNVFLNAFIYSGVVGFVLILILFLMMVGRCIGILTSWSMYASPYSFFIAGSLLIYIVNSLAHNSSLVTGDEIIWVLFGLLAKAQALDVSVDE